MILHLLTDEKFTDYVIRQFSGDSHTRIVLIVSNANLTYVHCAEGIRCITPGSPEFGELLKQLGDYKAIVLHGLFWPWQQTVIENVPSGVKIAWEFWGGDIYGRRDQQSLFWAPLTKILCRLHILKKRRTDAVIYEIPKPCLSRVDYCLSAVEEEYIYAKQYIGSDLKYLWYTYYSVEDTLGALTEECVKGNDIFLGNSATEENNHLDVFLHISKSQLKRKRLIVPLSYGYAWYRNVVERFGGFKYSNRFYPLKDFLPLSEYNQIMLGCNTMIMAHYRPQAQGNIITGLWLGMRVYMSERSMEYQFFRRIGVRIFTIEHDLYSNKSDLFDNLSTEDIEHNRKVLKSWFGKDNMQEKINEMVQVLNN